MVRTFPGLYNSCFVRHHSICSYALKPFRARTGITQIVTYKAPFIPCSIKTHIMIHSMPRSPCASHSFCHIEKPCQAFSLYPPDASFLDEAVFTFFCQRTPVKGCMDCFFADIKGDGANPAVQLRIIEYIKLQGHDEAQGNRHDPHKDRWSCADTQQFFLWYALQFFPLQEALYRLPAHEAACSSSSPP